MHCDLLENLSCSDLSETDFKRYSEKLKRAAELYQANGFSFSVDRNDSGYRRKITLLRMLKNYVMAVSIEKTMCKNGELH